MLRKKQKAGFEEEAKARPGIYVTKQGLCAVMGFSVGWINDHISLLKTVDNVFCGKFEYFSVSDVFMILNPSMSRKEADDLAFSTVLTIRRINKIIVERDAK